MSTTETDTRPKYSSSTIAAAILRIHCYAAAREWQATGGKTSIRCLEIGRDLLVPRGDRRRLLGLPA